MSLKVRKVLVPFDFSDHSLAALKRAIELVDPADIYVVNVLPFITAARIHKSIHREVRSYSLLQGDLKHVICFIRLHLKNASRSRN